MRSPGTPVASALFDPLIPNRTATHLLQLGFGFRLTATLFFGSFALPLQCLQFLLTLCIRTSLEPFSQLSLLFLQAPKLTLSFFFSRLVQKKLVPDRVAYSDVPLGFRETWTGTVALAIITFGQLGGGFLNSL